MNEKQPIPLSQLINNKDALSRRIEKRLRWHSAIGNDKAQVTPSNIDNIKRIGETRRNVTLGVEVDQERLAQVNLQIDNHPETLIGIANLYLKKVEETRNKLDDIRKLATQGHVERKWVKTAEDEFDGLTQKPEYDERLKRGLELLKEEENPKQQQEETLPTLIVNRETGEVTIMNGASSGLVKLNEGSARKAVFCLFTQRPKEEISVQEIGEKAAETGAKSKVAVIIDGIRNTFSDIPSLIQTIKRRGSQGLTAYMLNANIEFVDETKENTPFTNKAAEIVSIGDFSLNPTINSIKIKDVATSLTPQEFALISYLTDQHEEPIPSKILREYLRQNGYTIDIASIAASINAKLGTKLLAYVGRTRSVRWTLNLGEEPKEIDSQEKESNPDQPLSDQEAAILSMTILNKNHHPIKSGKDKEFVFELPDEIVRTCTKLIEKFTHNTQPISTTKLLEIRSNVLNRLRRILSDEEDIEKVLEQCQDNIPLNILLTWIYFENTDKMEGVIIRFLEEKHSAGGKLDLQGFVTEYSRHPFEANRTPKVAVSA